MGINQVGICKALSTMSTLCNWHYLLPVKLHVFLRKTVLVARSSENCDEDRIRFP